MFKYISHCLLLFVFAMGHLLLGNVHAASFDCKLAQSTSENIICNNAELSKLDEELATQYKTRLNTVPNPVELKSDQRRWLKQLREQCKDAQCYIKAYNARIASWMSLPPIESAAKPMTATHSNQSSKPQYKDLRFQFCKSNNAISCQETGHGYTVCEAYLKHLNSLPKDWQHGACKAWVNPALGDISLPEWESLNIADNLPLIYQLVTFRKSDIPSFEEWLLSYKSKIKDGKINPSLKRVELIVEGSEVKKSMLRYQEKDSERSGCDGRELPLGGYTVIGSEIYILDDHDKPVKRVGMTHAEMLFYKSSPFFINQVLNNNGSVANWWVGVYQPDFKKSNNYIPLICEMTTI